MPNEKQTLPLSNKLKSLVSALTKCGKENPDIDSSTPYISILEEVKDNLKDIQYYTEDFHKRNSLRKNIANYSRLIESVSLLNKGYQNQQYLDESSEEIKDENQNRGNNNLMNVSHQEKLQNQVREIEEKLKYFLRQQQSIQEESEIENGGGQILSNGDRKSNRRINNNEKNNYLASQNSDKEFNQYHEKNLKDLNLKKGLSEDPRSPARFNKGEEYCLEAHCLLNGHGIEPSTEDAILWYEKSANLGEPRAIYSLGKIYEDGIGVRIDIPKAVQHYERAAELGEPFAQYKLAKYYQKGGVHTLNDGKADAHKAFELLQSSASENQSEALREVGFIYEKGGLLQGDNLFVNLVEVLQYLSQFQQVDLNKALDFYLKSAQQGDELALNYLGSFNYNHTKDYSQAVTYFRKASENLTCDRALNNLAICFEQGIGEGAAEQDYYHAIKLYEISANNGYEEAMVNLGYLYYRIALSGQRFDDMDQEELYFQSVAWLRMALGNNENNKEALFLIAKFYEEGLSVDQNPILAKKYYEKAAQLDYPKAYTRLGHLYYSGLLMDSDEDRVTPFYQTQGQQNRKKAIEYYQKACDLQDSEAANCLGLLYESGISAEQTKQAQSDIDKALSYYTKALEFDPKNLDALFNMGLLLLNNQNHSKGAEGLKYIKVAAEKGNIRAREYLMINEINQQQQTNNFFNRGSLKDDDLNQRLI